LDEILASIAASPCIGGAVGNARTEQGGIAVIVTKAVSRRGQIDPLDRQPLTRFYSYEA